MKKFLLSFIFISLGTWGFAQQASDYFPAQAGYSWNYKVIPLDSANNEIDSLSFFRADSFAVTTNFMGRNADLVLSKSGPSGVINYLPYTDSTYFSFESTNGFQYFRISNLGNLITVLDSIGIDSTVLGVIQSFESWYSVFRFNQQVGSEYTIFSKDTAITINGTGFPLRFEYLGKRLDDETIQTDAGTFLCKKFMLSTVVSYLLILPPPLPPIPVELIRLETTKWISQNIWLVQEITPSQSVDLSYLGFGSFNIPGSKTVLVPLITDIKYGVSVPSSLLLSQNYPNPFNPATKINFRIPESGNVSLKIYNVLGKEIFTLLDEQKNPGSYSVTFNPETNNLSSGVYFYVLNFHGTQLTHKMIFLK